MAGRDMLAQLFLAGRSPEEQQARILKQRHDAGFSGSGGAFPSGPPGNAFPPAPQGSPLDMSQAGPWGAGQDPMSTGAVPTPQPRPSQFSLPQQAPIPTPSPGTFPPDLAVSPQMPPDPMAASAPTNATLPFVPGSSRMPPDLGVSPLMPPDPMAASAPTNNPPRLDMLSRDLAASPPMPRDPMAASAPTEIGAYEARRTQDKKKSTAQGRKNKTKQSQDRFKEKTSAAAGRGGIPQNAQPRRS